MTGPKLRFRRGDGTEYPEWKEKQLQSISEIIMGQSPSGDSVNEDDNGLPLVQGKADIIAPGIKPLRYTSSPTKICEATDIVMTVRAPVGYVVRLGFKACLGRGVCAIRANNVDDFLYFLLQSKESDWRKIEQGSTFTAVNSDDISTLTVYAPENFEEQQKIAAFLSDVDTVISASEAEVAALEQQKKGAMQKIFSQEVRFRRDDGTEYPEWEEQLLKNLMTVSSGSFVIKTKQHEDSKYPVYNGGITETGRYDEYNYDGLYVLMTSRGANAGFVNFINGRFWCGNSCYAICSNDLHKFSIYYAYYYLAHIKKVFPPNTQAMPAVNKSDVENANILVPSPEEQQKIADFLSSFDEAISLARQELEKWKLLKKGLMQQMFV